MKDRTHPIIDGDVNCDFKKPFPGTNAPTAHANPHGEPEFRLPEQQAEYDQYCNERALYRRGRTKWRHIDPRNTGRLRFQMMSPPGIHPQGPPSAAWPMSARAHRLCISPDSECVIPSLYDTAILVVRDGYIVGGMAMGSMRPVDHPSIQLPPESKGMEPPPKDAA